ncbi:hypothetical protein LOZ66_000235 [Ophidiomyces ophidiicola]|nr:hypothetical protein LOZ66_000235 [Ophidiomyces ophidiicola]
MSSENQLRTGLELSDSAMTLPSDSDTYPGGNGLSVSSEMPSNSVIVYQTPTIWRFLRAAAINLFLPFVNGLMLGFGELFAHEAAFRLGWSNTKFSSFTAARTLRHHYRPAVSNGSSICTQHPVLIRSSLLSSSRLFSSSPPPPSVGDTAASQTTTDNGIQSIDALSNSEYGDLYLSHIPETLGYLKELGLDFGFGPSSFIQMLLETIHIYSGLPWWGSTIAAALVIRVVLFKFNLNASDTSAKLRHIDPLTKPLQERMIAAAQQGNQLEALKFKQEISLIRSQHGVKMWKSFAPLLQIPLGVGFFRVLRAMATLPVPALLSEQFLWISDVSLGDPFFILPIVTGGATYLAMKRGGETGMGLTGDTPLGKLLIYAFPAGTTIAMCFWPSILQLYFASTGTIALLQTYLITSPSFRKFIGLSPLPPKPATKDEAQSDNSNSSRIRIIPTTARVVTPQQEQNAGKQIYRPQDASIIDRTIDHVRSGIRDIRKQMQEKMDEVTGEKIEKNADGTPKAPSRLSKQELENARIYEQTRRAQVEGEREVRNQETRKEYKHNSKKDNN